MITYWIDNNDMVMKAVYLDIQYMYITTFILLGLKSFQTRFNVQIFLKISQSFIWS